MAYAFCPACRSSFRYMVEVPPGPHWLKEVARCAGRGEQAGVLCYGCWVPLRVGDKVTVLYSAHSLGPAGKLAKGIVANIGTYENGATLYEVDALEEHDGCIWRHSFWRAQLKANKPNSLATERLTLQSRGQLPASR
jgi:hypothetical protein